MEINYLGLTHPFTTERCVQRLITEYNKHKNLIIAFDFDNIVIDDKDEISDAEELTRDMISLLACFSGKYYGKRSLERRSQNKNN